MIEATDDKVTLLTRQLGRLANRHGKVLKDVDLLRARLDAAHEEAQSHHAYIRHLLFKMRTATQMARDSVALEGSADLQDSMRAIAAFLSKGIG
jgi:hypothetical protein